MVILSVDYGDVRTGLAICDKLEMLASPLKVINEKYEPKLISAITDIVKTRNPELIVVGLPKNMDGSEGWRSEECKDTANKIRERGMLVLKNSGDNKADFKLIETKLSQAEVQINIDALYEQLLDKTGLPSIARNMTKPVSP